MRSSADNNRASAEVSTVSLTCEADCCVFITGVGFDLSITALPWMTRSRVGARWPEKRATRSRMRFDSACRTAPAGPRARMTSVLTPPARWMVSAWLQAARRSPTISLQCSRNNSTPTPNFRASGRNTPSAAIPADGAGRMAARPRRAAIYALAADSRVDGGGLRIMLSVSLR